MAQTDRERLRAALDAGGYSFPFDISFAVNQAIHAGIVDTNYVYSLIVHSQQFKSHYPGIFRPDGTMKMTPAQYEAYVDAATHTATASGFRITRAQVGQAIALSKSADEFAFDIKAAAEIRSNAGILRSFNDVLRASGQRPITTAQQAFQFLNGKAPKQVYDLYEGASIEAAAKSAGINISAKEALSLGYHTAQDVSYQDALKGFQQLASARTLAEPELRAFGLSMRDQENIALGIAKATTVAKFEQAVKQRQAALTGSVAQQQTGIDRRTGRPVTGTERDAGF